MRTNCHASRISVRLLLTTFVVAMLAAVLLPAPAFGQTAYFSITGDFNTAGDQLDVLFFLNRPVSNSETLRFETFASSGGTNAAGNSIADGPGDSVLRLLNSSIVLVAEDDDLSFLSRDALIGFNDGDTPLSSPLGADNYRLQLSDFDDDTDPFALDVVGPADALVPLGISRNVSSLASLSSLTIGTTGAGSDRATFFNTRNLEVDNVFLEPGSLLTQSENNLAANVITLNGGELEMAGGTLAASVVNVNPGGRLDVDGLLRVSGTPINGPVGVRTLVVQGSDAVADIDGLLTVLAGGAATSSLGGEIRADGGISVSTGGTLTVTDTGTLNANGHITVNGGEFNHHNTGLNLLATSRNLLATNEGQLRTTGSRLFFDGQRNATLNSGADWTHAGELIAGSAVGSGSITVDGIGSTLVVNGDITVNNNGTFTVRNLGTLDANGDITVDGGTFTDNNTGQVLLASGKKLLATNGGQVQTTSSNLFILADQTATINSGANWTHTGNLIAGSNFSNGTITIDGNGSTLNVNGILVFTNGGNRGVLNVQNSSQITSSGLNVGRDNTTASTDAEFNINTGGGLTTGRVLVGNANGSQGTGTINLAGSGSTLTQTGGSFLDLGNADTPGNGGVHAINVTNNAVYTTGTGTTTIAKTGTLNVNTGGTFNANADVIVDGGTINALGGSFTVGSDLVVNSNGELNLLGSGFTLDGTPITGLSISTPTAINDRNATLAGLFADGLPFSFDLNATTGLGDFFATDALLTLLLVEAEALAGDFNADGFVNAADYSVWRDGLGTTFTQSDYTVWANNYGATAGPQTVGVPEPSAGLLVLLASVICRHHRGLRDRSSTA